MFDAAMSKMFNIIVNYDSASRFVIEKSFKFL